LLGIDQLIAQHAAGGAIPVVLVVAILLGLRHATDPDHLVAVSTLVASDRNGAARRAVRLGLAWGLGHATTLTAAGLPIVFYGVYLPHVVRGTAELLVGLVIVVLAARLLVRRRHRHARLRSPLQAFGVGLIHGLAGSAAIGVLLLAAIHDHVLAATALAVFAGATAVSMAVLSSGFGFLLARPRVTPRVVPALGVASLAFGAWYALAAIGGGV
jgi:HupE / UreJ protein